MQLDRVEAGIGQGDHQPGPRSGVPRHHCIKIFRKRVGGAGVISDAEFEKIDKEVMHAIEESVQRAKKDPLPSAKELLTDVYVSY